MTAAVWTLIGLLTACLGVLTTALFAAISRVDGLRIEFNGRFDGLHDDLREMRTDIRDLRTAVSSLDHRLTVAGG